MKLLLRFTFFVLAVSLSGCDMFNFTVQYLFENSQTGTDEVLTKVYKDSTQKPSMSLYTYDVNTFKSDPITVNYRFSQSTPEVKKLLSIEMKAFSKNKKGEEVELPFRTKINSEYYDGKGSVKEDLSNNKEPLNKLLDWKTVNYSYGFLNVNYVKEVNSVSLDGAYIFEVDKYPDSVRLVINIKWEDHQEKIEKVLHKEKFSGNKFNPKF
jgi:hypothetical protein